MKTSVYSQEKILLLLFFLSGSSALIYQIIWQKLLFTAFGVNLQTIAIIVSVFMLGLGAGALAGGQFAERYPDKHLSFFILVEIGIGLFGFISYPLIRFVGAAFIEYDLGVVAVVNFTLLLFPTALMGATLPVLVAYLHQRSRNVGISIGRLYFFNTCGAALGCFVAGFILLNFLGYHATLSVAATLNVAVALLAYYYLYNKESVHNV